ncbi:putative aspartic peptidase A1 family, aspartic peptidase domain superfamily, xylanase inhibitor [Helianthus annuus]|nr:putative aspartic peptidase A1 family, aspartic peptidase domain superfamily, xylanase inhibitor [Helianthus annuus]
MHLLPHLIVVVILAFISYEHEAIAQYVPPYTSIVVPVTKHTDAAKPLYSVQIMTAYVNMQYLHANFLIDIDAPFIWHDCIVQWNIYPGSCPSNTLCTSPVSCEEYQCTDVRTTYSYEHNPPCPPVTNSIAWLGILYMSACANSSSFESFPANVTGVMAFSSSPYAFPAYLFQPLKRSLALCLPSNSSTRGVLFFGSGPYYLLPNSDVDVRSLLSYTPLLKHPDSFGYYIGVKAILIKNKSIGITGNFSTKLSTLEPYTVLRTDIYKRVIWAFSVAAIGIPLARPVSPFLLCYRSGYKFPNIDFSLEDGQKWTVDMSNSMKQVTQDVACLAFVDGGATAEHAIVIGTYQFEDNFLMFDLENSTFGFSSSLLHEQTSCSNFNFTLTDGN